MELPVHDIMNTSQETFRAGVGAQVKGRLVSFPAKSCRLQYSIFNTSQESFGAGVRAKEYEQNYCIVGFLPRYAVGHIDKSLNINYIFRCYFTC
jgi:hypothetical protein